MADSISLGKPAIVGLAEEVILSYCNETKQSRLTLMDQDQIFDTLWASQNPSLKKDTIDKLATHLSNPSDLFEEMGSVLKNEKPVEVQPKRSKSLLATM